MVRRSSSLSDLTQLVKSNERVPLFNQFELKRNGQAEQNLVNPVEILPTNEDGLDPTVNSKLYYQDQTTRDQMKSRSTADALFNHDFYYSQRNKQVTFQTTPTSVTENDPLGNVVFTSNPSPLSGNPLHSTYIIHDKEPPDQSVKRKPNRERDKVKTMLNQDPAVDAWIDELNPDSITILPDETAHDVQMQMLIQQRLPTQKLPTFDGSADKWVQFLSLIHISEPTRPY